MRIFAISDLHLPGGHEKPMEVFGEHWTGHFEKICHDWRERVTHDDLVLIPGDISWAMRLPSAMTDLLAIAELPGRKALLRGNHDYWWCGISQLRQMLPEGMFAVQNDALLLNNTLICGTRGWVSAGNEDDVRIYKRELLRMKMSLEDARRRDKDAPLLVMTHFPPLSEDGAETAVSELVRAYGARAVVYGHLHGAALKTAYNGVKDGVAYHCVSCDGLDFQLLEIMC